MKTHVYYWFAIFLVVVITGVFFQTQIERRIQDETEWCRKEQWEAKQYTHRLQKELNHFAYLNKQLRRERD
jgi:hypothetical protein